MSSRLSGCQGLTATRTAGQACAPRLPGQSIQHLLQRLSWCRTGTPRRHPDTAAHVALAGPGLSDRHAAPMLRHPDSGKHSMLCLSGCHGVTPQASTIQNNHCHGVTVSGLGFGAQQPGARILQCQAVRLSCADTQMSHEPPPCQAVTRPGLPTAPATVSGCHGRRESLTP